MRAGPCRPRSPAFLLYAVLLLTLLASTLGALEAGAQEGSLVLQMDVDDQITRATLEHFREVLAAAEARGADAILLRLDTPGGALAETQEMVKEMLRSPLPFIGYVSPVGASALSAGTMILMATDLAAMAPGTTIGSMQPVIVGPGGFEPVEDPKIINALVEQVQETLALHGRNESLADAFIRENLNLNAEDALEAGAIEVVAGDVPTLLAAVDGRTTVHKGVALDLAGAEVVLQEPSFRLRAIVVITNPVVASLLFLLGIYGIIFGISTPGHGAEIFGTIAIALGLVGLGFSINLVALFLIALGIALVIVEIATPSFGVVGTGGIIALVLGSIFLAPVRPPEVLITPEAQLEALAIILAPTAVVGAFLLFALYKVLQARRQQPYLEMVGREAVAVDRLIPGEKGFVRYEGELWRATAEETVEPDQKVYVLEKDGPLLTVGTEPPPEPEPRRPFGLLRDLVKRLRKE